MVTLNVEKEIQDVIVQATNYLSTAHGCKIIKAPFDLSDSMEIGGSLLVEVQGIPNLLDFSSKKSKEVLGDNGVFLYPTFPTPAFRHNEIYIKTAGVMYTMIFNMLGLPSTHVLLGLNKQGLPIGLQVIAAQSQDRLCLAVAKALEDGSLLLFKMNKNNIFFLNYYLLYTVIHVIQMWLWKTPYKTFIKA